MTDHVTLMREFAGQLRAQAARYEQAADLIEGEGAPPQKKKPATKQEGRQETRPTRAGRKAGTTRVRIADHLAKHPAATVSEIGRALGMKSPAVAYHLKALRK
jgi:DNA-binding transcriptional ArsR family regulator